MRLSYRTRQCGKPLRNGYGHFAWSANSTHRQFVDYRLRQLDIGAALRHGDHS